MLEKHNIMVVIRGFFKNVKNNIVSLILYLLYSELSYNSPGLQLFIWYRSLTTRDSRKNNNNNKYDKSNNSQNEDNNIVHSKR